MSCKVEEIDGETYFMDSQGNEVNEYWRLYSKLQNKRFIKVLNQMKETWFNVFQQMNFMRQHITLEESNNLMLKIHRQFINEHRFKTQYYNEEKLRLRKQKGYLKKKINKMKSSIQKI